MIEYKVLYICNYAAKYSGNFIASLSQLARMVGDKNVVYLFPTKAKGMDWINILSDHCNSMYFCDFKYKSLRTMCKQIACDIGNGNVIVHTHFVEDTLLLGVKASFKKIICHYHMTVPDTTLFRGKVKRIIRQIFYHNMVIVGVSDAVTKDLSKYFYFSRCESIPNAIDFAALDKGISNGYNMPVIEHEKFNVLIHGTHFERKGADLAVMAVSELNQENDVSYIHLYVTSHHVSDTLKKVKMLTSDLEYVHIIDVVENIIYLYDGMDLFISPSRNEAFGYAVVEAAYAECQVAASNIPGQNTMMVIPNVIWFEKENVGSLKQAIQQAHYDKMNGTAKLKKKEQREMAMKEFSIEAWSSKNMELYSRMVK